MTPRGGETQYAPGLARPYPGFIRETFSRSGVTFVLRCEIFFDVVAIFSGFFWLTSCTTAQQQQVKGGHGGGDVTAAATRNRRASWLIAATRFTPALLGEAAVGGDADIVETFDR